MKNQATEKKSAYDLRSNWPPYTYRDYPDIQPEMWTEDVFIMMASGLKKGGVLVTYSTKGLVKRNLISSGFKIEKLPGPRGKREILRATKI